MVEQGSLMTAMHPLARPVDFATKVTNNQLALAISIALFASAAWPIALTEIPPFQDLPNHLAAVTVITHPSSYPEFVFNGFLKTNSALFTWLYFVGKLTGLMLAARLFTLLVLALNALVFPWFVLHFTQDRRKLVVAGLLLWPMIHNWFVSMGMLDFALSVPLGLAMTVLLDAQARKPSLRRGLTIALLGVCTWYAHAFTVLVVHLLVAIHAATESTWRARFRTLLLLCLPLLPATLLVLVAGYEHLTEPAAEMTGYLSRSQLQPAWELAYNMWAEWLWGFTWLSISSFVPCVVLGIYLVVNRHRDVPMFSKWALIALAALYVFTPYVTTNWFYVNSRTIPFLWAAILLRVPDRMPRWLTGLLALSAGLYTVGMGIDYVRLDRDRAKFTAGLGAVPEGAKLLPLVFRQKLTSENTRSLLHAWGFYVIEKLTSAPLLFAHSRSFPVMYRVPPPPRFNHLVLESFAPSMGTPEWLCTSMRKGGVVLRDCEETWRRQWEDFWSDALPRFDHVLMWDSTPEARALVPVAYRVAFHEDRLVIYARETPSE
jgi:hypothetical protein